MAAKAFETFAGEFLRCVSARFAASPREIISTWFERKAQPMLNFTGQGDFARGVVEGIGLAFGKEAEKQFPIMLYQTPGRLSASLLRRLTLYKAMVCSPLVSVNGFPRMHRPLGSAQASALFGADCWLYGGEDQSWADEFLAGATQFPPPPCAAEWPRHDDNCLPGSCSVHAGSRR
jgi:hypothetical protein